MSNKIYRNKATNIRYEYIGLTGNGYHVLSVSTLGQPLIVQKPFLIHDDRFKTGYEEYKEPEKRTKYINLYRKKNGAITVGNAISRNESDTRAKNLATYGYELIGRSKVEIVEGHFDD